MTGATLVNAKVFIIEDDPTMVGLLKTLLNLEGFDSYEHQTSSNEPILNQITQILPDIIFLDVHLRDLDGLELIQQIKLDKTLQGIPVIMTSGTDYKDLCLKFGAHDFILKPYMPDDLISILKKIIIKE